MFEKKTFNQGVRREGKQRDCKTMGEWGKMDSPFPHLGVSPVKQRRGGGSPPAIFTEFKARRQEEGCSVGERQTAEVRFLITRVSLCILAIAAVHHSLPLSSLPPSWHDNFSPPSFLTDRESNRIHKIGPLRITPPLRTRLSALVFQRASDCAHTG